MRDPDDVSFMERRTEKEIERRFDRVSDVAGRDVAQRHRRGVLTVSADLDKGHLLAELRGAVEMIGSQADEIEELHAQIGCLEDEIEQLRGNER